jgi:hypothetical protein
VWWNDAVDEWVPALALRRSHTTCQGSEWLPGGQFHRCLEEYDDLQSCLRLSPECQAHLVRMSDKDLIYVSRHLAISDLFLYYLATQKDFVEVFRNDGVRIFRHVS